MWSRAGSAFVPSSRTTSPLTVTSPAAINSSAWRRDASPAAAINFCRRSSKNSPSGPGSGEDHGRAGLDGSLAGFNQSEAGVGLDAVALPLRLALALTLDGLPDRLVIGREFFGQFERPRQLPALAQERVRRPEHAAGDFERRVGDDDVVELDGQVVALGV